MEPGGFGLGNAAQIRGRQAGHDAAVYRRRETEALVSSQVVEAAEMSGARYETLEPAQEAVREALEMYRKFRDVSFSLPAGPKGQPQFDALETLTAVQARVQYLQQVVEFNRSQFRLYAAARPTLRKTGRVSTAATSTASAAIARSANVARRIVRGSSGAMPGLPPAAPETGRNLFRRSDPQPRLGARVVVAGVRRDGNRVREPAGG